jgi:hypothetical protein
VGLENDLRLEFEKRIHVNRAECKYTDGQKWPPYCESRKARYYDAQKQKSCFGKTSSSRSLSGRRWTRSLANKEDLFSRTNRLISESNESLRIIDIKSQVRPQNA